MPVKKQSVDVLLAPIVFCPKCRLSCAFINSNGERVLVRHTTERVEGKQCEYEGNVWTYPQPTLTVSEV